MFKIVSLNFSDFQGYQNAKTVDNTITPSEKLHIAKLHYANTHHHKAACRDRQFMADLRRSKSCWVYIGIGCGFAIGMPGGFQVGNSGGFDWNTHPLNRTYKKALITRAFLL